MRGLAITVGALGGALVASLARRAERDARERGTGLGAAVTSLPETLKADAAGLREDAAAAVGDGRAAGATREREVTDSIDAALRGGS